MKENIYYAGFLATVLLVFGATGLGISATTTTDSTQPLAKMNQTQSLQEGNVTTVAIGEGSNATVQHYTFTPGTVEINAGESVTWFSPSEITEIHTVTFVQDPNLKSDIILPFAIRGSNNTDFPLLPPFNAGEPIIIHSPDGGKAIVAVNKQAFNPAILHANNQTTYLNGTDIRYTMDGSEKAINSGIILPVQSMNETGQQQNSNSSTTTTTTTTQEGQPTMPPAPFPAVSSFTMTFEKPGTYPYFCAIHPFMTGKVIVGGGENQTQTQTQ
jgi:plastocyanin